MCLLQANVQCYDRFFEVSSEEPENAECVVEEVVSHVLLDLFSEGVVDDVVLHFASRSQKGIQRCAIQIHAQCSCQHFARSPRTKENMEIAVGESLAAQLREIFGFVTIDKVMLKPAPSGYDPALSCCMVTYSTGRHG
jgi:hypothetical protein